MNKITPQATIQCRKCKICKETLAHILGQCIYTKAQRIKRHNEIRDFITTKLASKASEMQIIEEAAVPTSTGGNLKPDLVVINQRRVLVVDVTLSHEDKGYLEDGASSKIGKYSPLLDTLNHGLRAETGVAVPVVVGTRSCMPTSTIDSLRELGITDRGSLITISMMAFRSSIELYHTFLDYNSMDT
jgi:hypothetical protein